MSDFDRLLTVQLRRRRRVLKRSRPVQFGSRLLFSVLAVGTFILGAAGLAAGWTYVQVSSALPPVERLETLMNPQNGLLLQPTRVYDRSGEHVIYSLENPGMVRRFLPLAESAQTSLSPKLAQSAVAILDPHYWQRPILSLKQLSANDGSGIAQRLVSGLLLDEKSAMGPLHLQLLAAEALTQYGREQILEWYLNSAAFGHLAYGAESAAQLYLGKSAVDLDWSETALLIAALEAPALNPLDTPAAAEERRQDILQRLWSAEVISAEQYHQAILALPVIAAPPAQVPSPARAFSQLVLAQAAEQLGMSRLERGGLRILTTLDYNLQVQVNCTIAAQLTRLSAGSSAAIPQDPACPAARFLPSPPSAAAQGASRSRLSASAVVLDPNSGEVLALAGDTAVDGGESALLESHPAGSLQTPFLALAAFARSLSPATLLWDLPDSLPYYTGWETQGPLRLRTALVSDTLIPLTVLMQQIGEANLLATARNLGITDFALTEDPLNTFFYGEPLNPLQVAHAYSAFATLGTLNGQGDADSGVIEPILLLEIEDLSEVVVISAPEQKNRLVAGKGLAYLVHDILVDEAARWPTLGYPNPLEIGRPAGAKVSPPSGGESLWAAGYTPQTVVLTWLGSAGEPLDARLAAGVWHALMVYTSQDQPILGWERPEDVVVVEVCDPSGLLPTPQCPNIVNEVFLAGTEPFSPDTLYQSVKINRETGLLATIFTPLELVEERTYLVVPPQAQAWIQAAGLPLPPSKYDTVLIPAPDPDANFSSPENFSYLSGKITLRGTIAWDEFDNYSLQVGAGINPSAWVTIVSSTQRPAAGGTLGVWDSSGLNGLYVVRMIVVNRDQQVKSAFLQVTLDNTPPEALLVYPRDGQVFEGLADRTITLQAEVSDLVGIRSVAWYDGETLIGERTTAPFALVWQAQPGLHRLSLRVTDLAGNQSESEVVEITVR